MMYGRKHAVIAGLLGALREVFGGANVPISYVGSGTDQGLQ